MSAALAGLLALSACGFTPVYGPEGGGASLLGTIVLPKPSDDEAYEFNTRFEERMGRAGANPTMALTYRIETTEQDIGATSDGDITRNRIVGRVFYELRDANGGVLRASRTNAFTGYSTTGSTAATKAAARDARKRLMVILADQVIEDLILHASDL